MLIITLEILILLGIAALVILFSQGKLIPLDEIFLRSTPSPQVLIADNPDDETSAVSLVEPMPTQTAAAFPKTSTPQATSSVTATTQPTVGLPLGAGKEYLVNQIKTGESFWILAQLYETTQEVMVQLNGLIPGISLSPDQIVVIQPRQKDTASLNLSLLSLLTVLLWKILYSIGIPQLQIFLCSMTCKRVSYYWLANG